jgi:D-sedoheptulose 7-phosphate isomerase
MSMDVKRLEAVFDEHLKVARETRATQLHGVGELASQLIAALDDGGKLVVFGNGGSAADAQHFAGELVGHYKRDRRSLAAVALTTDTSTLTAIANDYSFEDVFARQVQALGMPNDVVVGISTSGEAEKVVRGVTVGRRLGAQTWALTGASRSRLVETAENSLCVPSGATARIQEMHITIIHAVSELVDAWAAGEGT